MARCVRSSVACCSRLCSAGASSSPMPSREASGATLPFTLSSHPDAMAASAVPAASAAAGAAASGERTAAGAAALRRRREGGGEGRGAVAAAQQCRSSRIGVLLRLGAGRALERVAANRPEPADHLRPCGAPQCSVEHAAQ